MRSATVTDHWIQFQGRKFTIIDFAKHYKSSESRTLKVIVDFIDDWYAPTPYILQKTSGSTGNPKTIKIAKTQITASALATLETLGVRSGDHALLSINPEFIGGKMMIARAIIGDLNLTIGSIAGNPLIDLSLEEPVDFFSFVPYQLDKVLDESPEYIRVLDQSKAIILGGAPVSELLTKKIQSNFNNSKVFSTYGMTETVSHVALKLINSKKDEAFKALKNITFSINENNCLLIEAPEISGQKRLTTNDVVNLISPTEFHWLGRYDFVINSAGIKIQPEVLEKEINHIFNQESISNRFFVFGLPDEKLGQAVHLLIEGVIDTVKILHLLKEQLQPYHIPKKILTMNNFTETGSGKINRAKTIEMVV